MPNEVSMMIRSLLLGLLAAASISVAQLNPPASDVAATETNATATTPPTPVVIPGLDELKAKLETIQRANESANEKWNALVEQNNALSNVLAGLHQTLESQQRRETELSEKARTFNAQVMIGAGITVFAIFILSYWFQLRSMNRVMELSRTLQPAALAAGPSPALLGEQSERESKLLEAIKLLETRIQQLEGPPAAKELETPSAAKALETPSASAEPETVSASGDSVLEATPVEDGPGTTDEDKLIDVGPPEPKPAASRISLLLAKGEILLDAERYQEAVACFHDALMMEPTNAEAHLKKGIGLERMNRLEQALRSYEEAVRLNPNRAFAYVHKARVLAALHRYDEALSVYDSALGKNAAKGTAVVVTNGR